MPAISTGLAYVTVVSPQRRVDLALPAGVPLAELLPDLLRHAGDGLAGDAQAHGGWALRRGDGTALDPALHLAAQDVRDGDVLHLVAARAGWPEPEYDDLAEAVAAAAGRCCAPWSPAATRATGLVAAGFAAGLGLVALLRGDSGRPPGSPWPWPALVALAVAALLQVAGGRAVRGYGRAAVGACLAGYGLPYAFAAGLLLLPAGGAGAQRTPLAVLGAPHALVGSAVLVLAAVVGGLLVGTAARVFVAAAAVGLLAAAGALLGYVATAAAAAAVVLALLVLAVTALPVLAVRLGRLPLPPAPAEPATSGGASWPQPARVEEAVRRSEEILTGLLLGLAVAGSTAALLVLRAGGLAGELLVCCAATVLALRARLFAGRRHRSCLLAVGLVGYAAAAVSAVDRAPAGWSLFAVAVFTAVAVLVAGAGGRYADRRPSPYLARAADAVEAACTVTVVPLACVVVGLYDVVRALRW